MSRGEARRENLSYALLNTRRVEGQRRVRVRDGVARRQLAVGAALRSRRLRRGWCFGRGGLLGLQLLHLGLEGMHSSLDSIPLEPREPAREL